MPAFVDDGHADGQALDDVLAVVLEPLHLQGPDALPAVEIGVLQGQGRRAGDRRQQLPVLPGKVRSVRFLAHDQAADDLVLDLERQDVEEAEARQPLPGRPGRLRFGRRDVGQRVPVLDRPGQPVVERDAVGKRRAVAPRLEDPEGPPVALVGQEQGQALQVEGVGDGLEEGPGQLFQVPFAGEVAGDRQQGLPVLVASLVDGPVEEALEEPFQRREERRAEDDGHGAEDDGVEPVLREEARPGADEQVDGGEDEEGEGQGRRLLQEHLDVDQAVAGDGVGEHERDEGLEEDRQLGARRGPPAEDEGDDVEGGRG